MMFKAGDKVVCIDDKSRHSNAPHSYLRKDIVYTVDKVLGDAYLRTTEREEDVFASRFVLEGYQNEVGAELLKNVTL